MNEIDQILENQQKFFNQKQTLSISFRKQSLLRLKKSILAHENQIIDALYKDLKKPKFEAYSSEIAVVLQELDYFIKNIYKLSKPKRVNASIINFPSRDYIYKDPYGKILIIAPWNYPFQLSINPLMAAVAAGNCVVCKPSEISENSAPIIAKIIAEAFDPEHVKVVLGGIDTSQELLQNKWDYIFFTGSTLVGKIVMKAAAEQLCPVTLELGGKSPVIVDKDAKVALAAKRIAWGKLFNAGQTCIAPDYVYVHKSIKETFTKHLIKEFKAALGENSQESMDYARIVSQKHFERIVALTKNEEIIYGGKSSVKDHYIEPTILDNITWDSKIMQEEIFGPLLPLLSFEDLPHVIETINKKDKPLSAYYFGENNKMKELFLNTLYFGGGCINDTILHITNKNLPFGGIGKSGIGAYQGAKSFDCFSHHKGILKRGTWIDVPLRYAPYKSKISLVKTLFKFIK